LTEVFNTRKSFYPIGIIGENCLDRCLLEHDLRNPYFIGINTIPPGERPVVPFIPAE